MIVRELLTLWKIKVKDKELKKFQADLQRAQLDAKRGFDAISRSVKLTAFAIAGASAAIGVFLKKAGNFEQAQIAFETMLGSAERAAILLEDITAFAAKTPFQLTGLIESTKRVLAFGFSMEEVLPTLNTLGNIAAGVGSDKLPRLVLALGQVRAATKLRGQELRQFAEAGVPLLGELAVAQGKTEGQITDMIRAGKIGFKDVNDALVNLTTGSGRFANLMVKQSQTFLGIISNIIDALEVTAIRIGTEVLPEAKALANEFLNFLDINRKIIAADLGKFLKSLFELIKDLIFAFKRIGVVIKVIADLFGGLNNLLSFTMKAFAFFIGASLLFGIGLLAKGFFGLVTSLKAVRLAVLTVQASVIALPILIGAAIVAAALVLEDLLAFFRGDKSIGGAIKKSFGDALEFLNDKFQQFSGLVQSNMKAVTRSIRRPILILRTFAAALAALAGGDLSLALTVIGRGIKQFILPKTAEEALGFGDLGKDLDTSAVDNVLAGFQNFLTRTGGSQLGGGFIPGGLGALAPTTAPVAAGGSVFQIDVNSPITVPPGTPPQLVGTAVREGIQDAMENALRTTQQATEPQVAF